MGSFTEHSAEEHSISYRFPKEERLRSKKLIEQLFREGSSFNSYPLRFVTLEVPATGTVPVQVLVSVSKRYFKKAVDRNRIKRQVREVYRLHKHLLRPQKENTTLLIAFLYVGKEKSSFSLISKKLNSGLERLSSK